VPTPTAAGRAEQPLALLRLLQSAGGALSTQALLQAQLARIEWQEARQYLLRMLVAAVVGFACLLCTLLLVAAAALLATWGTPYRIHMVVGLIVLSIIGTAFGYWRFQINADLANRSFAASAEELAADANILKAHL
jgi:uncharacterized membrane protein YqjE